MICFKGMIGMQYKKQAALGLKLAKYMRGDMN